MASQGTPSKRPRVAALPTLTIIVTTRNELSGEHEDVDGYQVPIRRWTLDFASEPGAMPLEMLVKKLVVGLHPTFADPKRTLLAPFHLEERGWGEFDISVIVHFHDPARAPAQFDFPLSFATATQTIWREVFPRLRRAQEPEDEDPPPKTSTSAQQTKRTNAQQPKRTTSVASSAPNRPVKRRESKAPQLAESDHEDEMPEIPERPAVPERHAVSERLATSERPAVPERPTISERSTISERHAIPERPAVTKSSMADDTSSHPLPLPKPPAPLFDPLSSLDKSKKLTPLEERGLQIAKSLMRYRGAELEALRQFIQTLPSYAAAALEPPDENPATLRFDLFKIVSSDIDRLSAYLQAHSVE